MGASAHATASTAQTFNISALNVSTKALIFVSRKTVGH
jgi:hypothetical protein